MTITAERLRELFRYDPDTGRFICVVKRRGKQKPGDIVHCQMTYGYRVLHIDGREYKEHRLAFLYMTGSFPQYEVDHINGIRDDNRWCNLRDVPHSENMRNLRPIDERRRHHGFRSKYRGVQWCAERRKWRVYFNDGTRRKYLGLFCSEEEAHFAYMAESATAASGQMARSLE